jgi:hypothetical protein
MKIIDILFENFSNSSSVYNAIEWLKENEEDYGNSIKMLRLKARDKFKFIASGGTREVYAIDESYVLKIAISEKDRFQNKSEINSFFCGGDKFLAKIISYDSVFFNWIIMERAGTDKKNLNSIIEKMFIIPENDIKPLEWFSSHLSSISFQDWQLLIKFVKPEYKDWLIGFLEELYKCTSWIDLIEDNLGYRLADYNIIIIDYGDRTSETSIDVQKLKKNFSRI